MYLDPLGKCRGMRLSVTQATFRRGQQADPSRTHVCCQPPCPLKGILTLSNP